jgi:hypothetical protein
MDPSVEIVILIFASVSRDLEGEQSSVAAENPNIPGSLFAPSRHSTSIDVFTMVRIYCLRTFVLAWSGFSIS